MHPSLFTHCYHLLPYPLTKIKTNVEVAKVKELLQWLKKKNALYKDRLLRKTSFGYQSPSFVSLLFLTSYVVVINTFRT